MENELKKNEKITNIHTGGLMAINLQFTHGTQRDFAKEILAILI